MKCRQTDSDRERERARERQRQREREQERATEREREQERDSDRERESKRERQRERESTRETATEREREEERARDTTYTRTNTDTPLSHTHTLPHNTQPYIHQAPRFFHTKPGKVKVHWDGKGVSSVNEDENQKFVNAEIIRTTMATNAMKHLNSLVPLTSVEATNFRLSFAGATAITDHGASHGHVVCVYFS